MTVTGVEPVAPGLREVGLAGDTVVVGGFTIWEQRRCEPFRMRVETWP